MRLIRTILLLAGVGFLLPSPPETEYVQTAGAAEEQVSTFEMLSSATSAVSDVAGFCGRQPEVCETAAYLGSRLEAKAKYSARLIYEWASESTQVPAIPAPTQEAVKMDLLTTGTALASASAASEQAVSGSQSTLELEDLIPEWRGPVKKRPQAEEQKEG